MAVTEEIIKKHPIGTRKRYSDIQGLYLDINKSGNATWILRKMASGKRESITIGYYPDMSIEDARKTAKNETVKIEQAKSELRPSLEKKAREIRLERDAPASKKAIKKGEAKKITFAEVYYEFMELKMIPVNSKTYCESVHSRTLTYLLPYLGNLPLDEITSPMILETVRRIEKLGRIDTAKRTLGIAYSVFDYAKACRYYFAPQNPAADMSKALASRPVKHMAYLTRLQDIGKLLYAVSNYGSFFLRHAIKIQAYTFVRASELRFAQWDEIDFSKGEWKIPAERMKMPSPHIVPLSKQVTAEFRALQEITDGTRHVFRSTQTPQEDKPFSEAAVLIGLKSCLRTIGMSEDAMVGHGWRSVASTILNESNHFRADVIERQLSHLERDKTRASYNYAQYIPERRRMMQWYSDHLDKLEETERKRSEEARDLVYWKFSLKKKESV